MSSNLHIDDSIFSELNNIKRFNRWFLLPILTFVFIVVGQIISIVPVVETDLIQPELIESYPYILYFLSASFLSILLLLIMWVKYYEGRSIASIGLNFNSNFKLDAVSGAVTALFMGLVIVLVVQLFGGYEFAANPPLNLINVIPPLLLFFGFAIQSWVEEVFFRGWLLSRFYELKGRTWAIVASSLLFVAVHLMSLDFTQFSLSNFIIFLFMTFLFSAYLAIMTLKYKSIWFASAWHALWNWFFINGAGLPTTGISLETRPLLFNMDLSTDAPIWLSGGIDGPENSVITIIILLIATIIAIKYIKQRGGPA